MCRYTYILSGDIDIGQLYSASSKFPSLCPGFAMPCPPPVIPNPVLSVIPEPLSSSSFASFGTVISSPLPANVSTLPPLSSISGQPDGLAAATPEIANQASALKYSPVSPLVDSYAAASPSGTPGSPRMSMFSCFPRALRKAVVVQPETQTSASTELFDVRILERHPYTTQTFIPMGSLSRPARGSLRSVQPEPSRLESESEPVFLVIVAPSKIGQCAAAEATDGNARRQVEVRDPPDLRRLRAFVATAGQAVTYGAGTWHAPMVVLGRRRVDFVVVQFVNGVDNEDCQEVAFGDGVVVDVGAFNRKPRLWSKV